MSSFGPPKKVDSKLEAQRKVLEERRKGERRRARLARASWRARSPTAPCALLARPGATADSVDLSCAQLCSSAKS